MAVQLGNRIVAGMARLDVRTGQRQHAGLTGRQRAPSTAVRSGSTGSTGRPTSTGRSRHSAHGLTPRRYSSSRVVALLQRVHGSPEAVVPRGQQLAVIAPPARSRP